MTRIKTRWDYSISWKHLMNIHFTQQKENFCLQVLCCYLFCFKAEYPLCCFLTQDWPCSYGFHAFPPRGETESSADHGAGASHPQSTHLQGTAVELIHALYIHLWFKSIPSRNFIVFTLCVLMHRVSIFHQRIWDVKRNTDSLCSSGSLTVCVCLCLCAFIYALVCVCAGPE